MLFGEYLISMGLISSEQYVNAMIIQANELPSLPAAVNDLKLLTVEDQLRVFNYQSSHLMDYRLSCVELGLWDETVFEHALIRYFLSRIRAIGDILISEKFLTPIQLAEVHLAYSQLDESSLSK
jgi:hypothetical protein